MTTADFPAARWNARRCSSSWRAFASGLIDVVVVYKVDRLTRSLADFARMVELFDAQGVSFVAVTQQFNTTTSMGRLTLNVLLSFAQFEREVIGERIRDKVAASKRKGIWMGGTLPIGYDVLDRKLVVNENEAKTVQQIFERYLELLSVRLLKKDLDRSRSCVCDQSIEKRQHPRQPAVLARSAIWPALQPNLRGCRFDTRTNTTRASTRPSLAAIFGSGSNNS